LFHDCNTKLSGGHDAIFIFVKTLDEMVKYTQQIINEQQLVENGYLFFAYPKKTNSSAASQCVADYEDQVKDVEELLSPYPIWKSVACMSFPIPTWKAEYRIMRCVTGKFATATCA
jgi:hypothetical protein